MPLNYVTRLGEEGFVRLINFCIEEQNKMEKKTVPNPESLIESVIVHDELERRDLSGNRYIWVRSFAGPKVLNRYIVKDFDMVAQNAYGGTTIDCTYYMRKFMAKQFGRDYIKAVYQYQILEAETEMKRLLDCLPKEKKR